MLSILFCIYLILYINFFFLYSFFTEGKRGYIKHGEDKGKPCNEDSLQICMYSHA